MYSRAPDIKYYDDLKPADVNFAGIMPRTGKRALGKSVSGQRDSCSRCLCWPFLLVTIKVLIAWSMTPSVCSWMNGICFFSFIQLAVSGLHYGWKLACIFLALFEDNYRNLHRKVKATFRQNWGAWRRFSMMYHAPNCNAWRQAVNNFFSSQREPETCQRLTIAIT